MGMTALSENKQTLDGDLASIFRQRHTNVQGEWGSLNLAQEELNWEYPSSLSPQSPFEYMEKFVVGNRLHLEKPAPYNHAYSSLRPPAPHSQLTASPLDTSQLLQPFSCQKLDQESVFQAFNQWENNNQNAIQAGMPDGLDAVLRSAHDQGLRREQQQYAVDFFPLHSNQAGAQSSTWANPVDCKVDRFSTELESEILGDLRPRAGFPAYHPEMWNPQAHGQPQVERESDGMQGGNWAGSMMQPPGGQQQPTSVPRIIRALEIGGGLRHETGMEQQQQNPATGLQLVHLLLACAEAVANEQIDIAHVILVRLNSLVAPRSNTMQRLGAVFVEALTARITKTANTGLYMGLQRDKSVAVLDTLESFSVIYDCTPMGKFLHLTLNQIMLDAVEGESNIHVIDLNTGWRGMQWPAFIQALAVRPGGPPKLRITSTGKAEDLEHSKEKLQDFARALHVPFEFCPIVEDLEAFDIRMVDIREWEVICINSFNQLHQLLARGNQQLHRFLCDLRSLNPRVVALSENDGDHNSPTFLHRFVECLRYYSAVFDAFDASVPPGSPALFQIEQLFSGQKIRNIIACEGADRIERHESMASWSLRMEAAGFRASPISTRAINQARLLLSLYYHSGFTLTTENASLILGWYNMGLLGITAWQ